MRMHKGDRSGHGAAAERVIGSLGTETDTIAFRDLDIIAPESPGCWW